MAAGPVGSIQDRRSRVTRTAAVRGRLLHPPVQPEGRGVPQHPFGVGPTRLPARTSIRIAVSRETITRMSRGAVGRRAAPSRRPKLWRRGGVAPPPAAAAAAAASVGLSYTSPPRTVGEDHSQPRRVPPHQTSGQRPRSRRRQSPRRMPRSSDLGLVAEPGRHRACRPECRRDRKRRLDGPALG
jgi:hypothetical protein